MLKGNEEFYIRDKLMKQGPGKGGFKYCANIIRMAELPCGHYPTEQAPEETYQELSKFFATADGKL